jgi:hypothetical protein
MKGCFLDFHGNRRDLIDAMADTAEVGEISRRVRFPAGSVSCSKSNSPSIA